LHCEWFGKVASDCTEEDIEVSENFDSTAEDMEVTCAGFEFFDWNA